MRMVMVSIRDFKSEAYMRPWFARSTGDAIRTFQTLVNKNDNDNMLYTHPSDFALYEIGLFDDSEGVIYPYDVKKLLLEGGQASTRAVLPDGVTVV